MFIEHKIIDMSVQRTLWAERTFVHVDRSRISDAQLDVLISRSSYIERLQSSLLTFRAYPWIAGDVSDIRPGTYISSICHGYDLRSGLFDVLERDPCPLFVDPGVVPHFGYSIGLENNVYIRSGDKHVLVMDNHLYAMPFLAFLYGQNVIRERSGIVHVDEHADDGHSEDFIWSEYLALEGLSRMEYLYGTVGCANWISPLLVGGLIDQQRYHYIALGTDLEGNYEWRSRFLRDTDSALAHPVQACFPLYIEVDEIRPDILDIDIDCVDVLDRSLSFRQKEEVLNGTIPQDIREKLDALIIMAGYAPVITIATSPGYIDQTRAMQYVLYLLRGIGAA